jgi:hypothetical protein
MKTRIAMLLILALCSTGCIAAAAGVAALRASESRQEAAKTSAKASDTAAYNQYISQMEQVNSQRQKNGLKPEPILSFEEWKSTH